MPIKLGLVYIKRQQQNIITPRQLNYKPRAPQPAVQQLTQNKVSEKVAQPQSNGLSLRRVMNAPKTGCKSCSG